MKQRAAVGPCARAALVPYHFLIFLAPIVAEGGVFSRVAAPAVRAHRLGQQLENSTAKGFLRASASSNNATLVIGDLPDEQLQLGDLPDEQLKLTHAASAERLQAENIADRLEKQVLELAKEGGPVPTGFLKQVRDLVEKVLTPSVLKRHQEDEVLLKHLYDDYAGCDLTKTTDAGRAEETNRVRVLKSNEHRQCRQDEADLFTVRSECEKTLDLTTSIKDHVCSAIKDSRVGPADETSTCIDRFCHYLPGENYEMYLRRTAAYFNKKLQEFERAKGACEEMTAQAEEERQRCSAKVAAHSQKKAKCDAVQESLERAACVTSSQARSGCDAYGACYVRANSAYAKIKPMLQQREDDRQAEWRALKRIKCLLRTLADGEVTNKEVDGCVKEYYSVYHLDLVFKSPPLMRTCKAASAEGRTIPCTGEYVKAEYDGLPRRAPSKTCTPCAGPPLKDQVPPECSAVKCDWTLRHSCPDQPLGSRGPATVIDGPLNGYRCCCKYGMWKSMKQKLASAADSVPIVTVARGGGTAPLGPAFWAHECRKIPPNARSVRVVMGRATDYFRPADHYSFCDMLTSNTKHLWSADGINWQRPKYYPGGSNLGGSAQNWPKNSVPDDYRQHLSFWGDSNHRGGCCSFRKTEPYDGWGQGFTMSYVPNPSTYVAVSTTPALYPLKVNYPPQPTSTIPVLPLRAAAVTSGCGSVMKGDAYGGPYDDAYWRRKCQAIPDAAKSIRVKMGEWSDYFKPLAGGTICEMLTSHDMHMWSPDGLGWVTPAFYPSGSFLGGSSLEWPTTQSISPSRRYVSFWGHSWQRGGCCSSKKDDPYQGWSQEFSLEYCV